jgi:hypothetical protein
MRHRKLHILLVKTGLVYEPYDCLRDVVVAAKQWVHFPFEQVTERENECQTTHGRPSSDFLVAAPAHVIGTPTNHTSKHTPLPGDDRVQNYQERFLRCCPSAFVDRRVQDVSVPLPSLYICTSDQKHADFVPVVLVVDRNGELEPCVLFCRPPLTLDCRVDDFHVVVVALRISLSIDVVSNRLPVILTMLGNCLSERRFILYRPLQLTSEAFVLLCVKLVLVV